MEPITGLPTKGRPQLTSQPWSQGVGRRAPVALSELCHPVSNPLLPLSWKHHLALGTSRLHAREGAAGAVGLPGSVKSLTCVGGAINVHGHVDAPDAACGQVQCCS